MQAARGTMLHAAEIKRGRRENEIHHVRVGHLQPLLIALHRLRVHK
jgi:hypothetical protein